MARRIKPSEIGSGTLEEMQDAKIWTKRRGPGAVKAFATPGEMWARACEYFEWARANPLYQTQLVKYKEHYELVDVPKLRAFTVEGLCSFLGVNSDYFRNFMNQDRIDKEHYSPVIARIRDVIYQQKFEGAASDMLNANIIARSLGLQDRTDITTGDKPLASMQPIILPVDVIKNKE